MTDTTAKSLRPVRRPSSRTACALGVAIGLFAATAGALPASVVGVTMAQSATGAMADPAKRMPGAVTVSAIDFKRGDGGSGKLILRFSGDGAAPDLRNMGSSVVVDIGNAQLPAALQRPINVTDFATPVQRIDARATSSGAQLVLGTQGAFESMAYQSGNEYIVEVIPRAGAVAKAAAAPAAAAMGQSNMGQVSSTSTVRYSGRPVTFNFQDVPVRTVLQLIAEESNLNIVAADTVQGNVTLRLINVPWDQALDIVLQAKSLDKRRSGNVVWVAPQTEIAKFEQDKEDARIALENRAETITEYIPINYGNAEDIAKLLTDESKGNGGSGGAGAAGGGAGGSNGQRGFLSPRGSISFDRRTNTLLVIDIPQKVADIRGLVAKLDKPVDQVVIEARIVIATETVARELGARFGISGSNNDAYFSGNLESNALNRRNDYDAAQTNRGLENAYNTCLAGPNPAGCAVPNYVGSSIVRGLMTNLPAVLNNPAGSLALSILNAGYLLDVELSAIQEQGRGEVISNPRIVTSNQKEAVIRQGREIGYLTVTGGDSNSVPTVEFKEALLELKVTPTITNDGRVFMNLAVKKDELEGFISVGTFGDVPQIAKRDITTAVLVEDGQTVVIGGVYEFRDRTDIAKVPFLGDLPFLGNLFRNKGRSKEKAELLIFVTPKVMRVAQRM